MDPAKAARLGLIALCAWLLWGCADPKVRYERVGAGDEALKSLASNQVLFALRSTDITVASKDAKDDACPSESMPSRAKWSRCLQDVVVLLTSNVPDNQLIVATGVSRPYLFHEMAIYSSPLTDQTGNVSQVAFAYSDTTAQAIGSIGAGALAGSAFGPIGTFVGAIFGFAGAAATAGGGSTFFSASRFDWLAGAAPRIELNSIRPPWRDNLCEDPDASHASPESMELVTFAPYVIALDQNMESSLERSNHPGRVSCWNTIPLLSGGSKAAKGDWSGWVYQLRLTPLLPNTYDALPFDLPLPEATGKVTNPNARISKEDKRFPYVPCQSAELRLSWVTELFGPEEAIAYRSIPLQVANPDYVRYLQIPKTGTIKLGTICNASVAPGVFAGSTPQADTDALLKAIADIKAAKSKS